MKEVRRKHAKIPKVFYLFNHHSITPSLHHSTIPLYQFLIPQGFSIKITMPSLFCLQPFAFSFPLCPLWLFHSNSLGAKPLKRSVHSAFAFGDKVEKHFGSRVSGIV